MASENGPLGCSRLFGAVCEFAESTEHPEARAGWPGRVNPADICQNPGRPPRHLTTPYVSCCRTARYLNPEQAAVLPDCGRIMISHLALVVRRPTTPQLLAPYRIAPFSHPFWNDFAGDLAGAAICPTRALRPRFSVVRTPTRKSGNALQQKWTSIDSIRALSGISSCCAKVSDARNRRVPRKSRLPRPVRFPWESEAASGG